MNTSTYQNESSGITDWKKSTGRAIRTDGCVFILCTGGRATVAANMQKMVFRKDDLAVLTSDVYFAVSEVSSGFQPVMLLYPSLCSKLPITGLQAYPCGITSIMFLS